MVFNLDLQCWLLRAGIAAPSVVATSATKKRDLHLARGTYGCEDSRRGRDTSQQS